MSRTDAHRPLFVWLRDHPEFAVEHHRHGDGECDLPATPSLFTTRCRWELSDDAPWYCGCAMCNGGPFQRLDVRTRRQVARVVLAWRDYDTDEWDEREARIPRRW